MAALTASRLLLVALMATLGSVGVLGAESESLPSQLPLASDRRGAALEEGQWRCNAGACCWSSLPTPSMPTCRERQTGPTLGCQVARPERGDR